MGWGSLVPSRVLVLGASPFPLTGAGGGSTRIATEYCKGYTHTHARAHARTHARTHTYTHTCTHTRTHARAHTHTYRYAYASHKHAFFASFYSLLARLFD